MFANDAFSNYTVAHDRLEIDAVIILTLVEEMEVIDAFVKHVFATDTF